MQQCEAVQHFTGGTGRFQGATGQHTDRGCFGVTGVSDTGVLSYTIRYWDVGTITYYRGQGGARGTTERAAGAAHDTRRLFALRTTS